MRPNANAVDTATTTTACGTEGGVIALNTAARHPLAHSERGVQRYNNCKRPISLWSREQAIFAVNTVNPLRCERRLLRGAHSENTGECVVIVFFV